MKKINSNLLGKLITFSFLGFTIFSCNHQDILANNIYIAEDVEISDWAFEEVENAIKLEIVPLELQGNYLENITRAEFAALSVAFYEKVMEVTIEGRSTFLDTSDLNVEKMAFLGVVSGVGDGYFEPTRSITREEAAVLLSNLSNSVNCHLAEEKTGFNDVDDISSWAISAVGKVEIAGIMSGVDDNKFMPKNNYTIEQSIATIMRIYNNIK